MNANEKSALERAIKQANPGDVTVEPISSINGSNGIREAIEQPVLISGFDL